MPPVKKLVTAEANAPGKVKQQSRRKIRKRSKQQKHNTKLEQKIHSKDWIVPDPARGILEHKCKICNIPTNPPKSATAHLKGEQHKVKVLSETARDVEYKFSVFFAEHDIPFNVAEHLGPLLTDCFYDSAIGQKVTINREMVKNRLIKDIGPKIKLELAKKLRTCKFSILADELTDTSSARTFCIMVRYFDSDDGRIKISFWKLSKIENTDGVNQRAIVEHLYENIKGSFKAFDIPNNNIVGFGSDGSNVIMSGQNSVASRFKEDYRNIATMGFISDSIHLCTSKACEKLPKDCEELVRVVYNYLLSTIEASVQLDQFQELLDLKPREMLHPSQDRWLSLTAVVDCMLKKWPSLTSFFEGISLPDIFTGGSVLRWLKDVFMMLYFHFLKWVLPKFNNFNDHFQSSRVVITELKGNVEKLYKGILKCFLKDEYVDRTKLQNIDPTVPENHLRDEDMLLGTFVRTTINSIARNANRSPDILNKLKIFHDNCRSFLEAGAMEIKNRWNFGDPAIAGIAALHPEVSRGSSNLVRLSSIRQLAEALPRISLDNEDWRQQIDVRWRELPMTNFPEDIAKENEPEVFWKKILDWKNGADENEFSSLARFALDALISPHTNADYKRIFRKINLMRIRSRDKLEYDCEAMYHAVILSDDMKRDENGRVRFPPRENMINSITSSKPNGKPDAIASTSRN